MRRSGELALDGAIAPVAGVLPAAMHAFNHDLGLICPLAGGGEAAWVGGLAVLAPTSLLALINHFKGSQVLRPPAPKLVEADDAARPRPARHQGPGDGEARARSGRGRRATTC